MHVFGVLKAGCSLTHSVLMVGAEQKPAYSVQLVKCAQNVAIWQWSSQGVTDGATAFG